MIELQHTTFIIPIKIEHTSRYENAQTTLQYINKHLNTNVYILEVSEDAKSKIDFLSELNNLNIKHWVGVCDGTFHRTKYLNQMQFRSEKSKTAKTVRLLLIWEMVNI